MFISATEVAKVLRGERLAVPAICMAAMLACSALATAQTIYRYVDATGRIVFSDRPDPAARAGSRPSPPHGRPFDTPPDARAEVDNALFTGSAISSPQSIGVDFNEAARRLQQATLKREQGAQVYPGERVAGASPGALNGQYWLRQEMLQRQFDQASRRYGETRSPR